MTRKLNLILVSHDRMTFDGTVNAEGLATVAAAVGATTAYIIDLIGPVSA